jgi:D-psicose/D-tagatose/L-ribulose 3-epimerase
VKIGCCATYQTFVPEVRTEAPLGHKERLEYLKQTLAHLRDVGYDFVEFTVGMVDEAVSEEEYASICSAVTDAGIPVLAFNCFIPGRLKIAGPEADLDALRRYVEIALRRVASIGASIVVFGSGAARRVPDGWPMESAREQIKRFVEMAGEVASTNGVTIAIEHLNRGETNFGNSLASTTALAREIGLPSVRVLADLYHLDKEGESLASVREAGSLLVHTHVADTGRLYPGSGNADLAGFVQTLKDIQYDAGISVECAWHDFRTESAEAARVLRRLIGAGQ